MAILFISYELAQVMELENIVANTVYIKARESKFSGVRLAVAMVLVGIDGSELCPMELCQCTRRKSRKEITQMLQFVEDSSHYYYRCNNRIITFQSCR